MGIAGAYMVPHPPLIIPEIGKGREREIQKTVDGYREVANRIGQLRPETIVLISPHQTMYRDYFHISPGDRAYGDFGQFGAGWVRMEVTYDTAFVGHICRLADAYDLSAGMEGERSRELDHGTMVPLWFVNQEWKKYKLVRIGLSGLPLQQHFALGRIVRETADALERKTVIIASGDLSHRLRKEGPYGYAREGPEYDSRVMDVMERGVWGELLTFSDKLCDRAGECGHRSYVIMAGALEHMTVKAERLSYEGPFGVGYGICAYEVIKDAYTELARQTIEEYVRNGEVKEVPKGLPEEMYRTRAGAFVSVKKKGMLRGCIGTIQAVCSSVAEEIIQNAISAVTNDPRFDPVEPYELKDLSISVDVLGARERISSPKELDAKKYGVIVTKGYRRGLLLPNLEGVDTVEEQIRIAKQKAGIGTEEGVVLERFEVVRHN